MKFDLSNFLNKKKSTRNLSDEDFENILEIFASALYEINYHYSYTEKQLYDNWENLLKQIKIDKFITAQKRSGMKILEQFMDNLWEVENYKGKSFKSSWTKDNLKKVLRINRKAHSTPYLSEIRRMIYFTSSLPKTTMYRPLLAKSLCLHFKPKIVLDPCVGWGGRMLGVVSTNCKYIGFEPQKQTYDNLLMIVKFLGIKKHVKLYNEPAEKINKFVDQEVDMIMTSPPYFNLEVYGKDDTQSYKENQSYDSWKKDFLYVVLDNCFSLLKNKGLSCWNVANIKTTEECCLIDDVKDYHKKNKFNLIDEFGIISSKRITNNSGNKNKDVTFCFQKK